MKINWKQKLSSRKFWAAIISYITGILATFNISDNAVLQITAILGGIGALMVYILAETYVDGKRESNTLVDFEKMLDDFDTIIEKQEQ